MDNTIIQQGYFVSDGSSITIPLRSDVDWMTVYNITQAAASQTTAVGVKYFWQRGYGAGAKWTTLKSNAANAANLEQYVSSNGFTLIDTSVQTPGVLLDTITDVSTAAIPVVSNSGTNGLVAGNVVRLFNITGAQQLGGYDFTVGNNTLTPGTFSLDYMKQLLVLGTTGFWRKISFNPIYYPRRRSITKITAAANAVVTLSVTHQFEAGQKVRLIVPPAFGMVEMNNLQATILSVDETVTTGNSITLDIDSSAFTAFVFPPTAAVPFSPAEVVPMGEDTSYALAAGVDILSDATDNESNIGIRLTGGVNCPGGANMDELFWVAGKSFSANTI